MYRYPVFPGISCNIILWYFSVSLLQQLICDTCVLMYLVCMCVCAQVWRVEDLELVLVDPEWYGYFYGGDCYLILYTYLVNNRKSYLLYIWQVSPCQKCTPLIAPGLPLRIISVLLKGK